jgi:signal transduction histidine kinase
VTDARIDPLEVPVSEGAPAGARPIRAPTRFAAAAAGAAIVVGLAAILVIGRPWSVGEILPVLVGGAGLSLSLLARRAAPGLAWIALIVASLVGSGVPIGLSQMADPGVIGVGSWLVIAARSAVAAVITAVIAALYATRPERQLRAQVTTLALLLVGWLAVACLLALILVVAGARSDPALNLVDVALQPIALFVNFVVLLAALGVAGDLRAAIQRADDRRRDDRDPPLGERVRAVLRELIPGQAAADAAAIEAERGRLAGDLHAVVLPSLRRAIAEAEAGLPIEDLADRLRTVDLEIERLMADRWPVVLEAFGLVAALEDLAERTEADTASAVQVVLEIDRAAGRPRPEIERTTWRIAQLALDNAVRHAAATRITIVVAVAPDRVRLSVADDGRGLDSAAPVRPSARGLSDLGRRASSVGGTVAIEAGRPTGTVVRFDWPA